MIDDAQDVEGPADPASDAGLIALRGPNLFSGYWPGRTGGPDADGWFVTSDMGFLDGSGALHLVDRSSDLVVVSGFTVYPHEVERVLGELPAVVEAAVVGVPDERTGQAVRAVVVRVAGAELDADAVRAHCRARLARFKVPAQVVFVDELPRTAAGRLARHLLVDRGRPPDPLPGPRGCTRREDGRRSSEEDVRSGRGRRAGDRLHPGRLPRVRAGRGRRRPHLRRAGGDLAGRRRRRRSGPARRVRRPRPGDRHRRPRARLLEGRGAAFPRRRSLGSAR